MFTHGPRCGKTRWLSAQPSLHSREAGHNRNPDFQVDVDRLFPWQFLERRLQGGIQGSDSIASASHCATTALQGQPSWGPPGSRWEDAVHLLNVMDRSSVQRDVVSFNAVLSACENLGECLGP